MAENVSSPAKSARARLSREGLVIDGHSVPLLAGSVSYFQLDPEDWRPALEAVLSLGLTLVDTCVPWSVHERSWGELDFGEQDPRLDVIRFLRLVEEVGLYACVRPGPRVNAELTQHGLPARIVWNAECQARSAGGKPIALPAAPLAFPFPSYASRTFLREAGDWLRSVGSRLSPLCHPNGPIVLCHLDDGGATDFSEGAYQTDYHPDAIRSYHKFLRRKYKSTAQLSRALGRSVESFEIDPPRRLQASTSGELAFQLDFAEAQEELLALSLGKLGDVLRESGVSVPFSHHLPTTEALTPLDPGRVAAFVDVLGLDYNHGSAKTDRAEIARRTSELRERAEAGDVPAFACEMSAGFAPFSVPLSENDDTFTLLTAIAYGLSGYDLYMAVEKGRWISAPFDRKARPRPSAEAFRKITNAFVALGLNRLKRQTPVHLVVPRSLQRLRGVLHEFGPLGAELFGILGYRLGDASGVDQADLGAPLLDDARRFMSWLEEQLEKRRIPFAVVGGDLIEHSLEHARWTIVACAGGLEQKIVKAVSRGLKHGVAVSIGPHFPQRDETFVPREPPSALRHAFGEGDLPTLIEFDPERLGVAIDHAVELLNLPLLLATPDEIEVCVQHDVAGIARVLFVINPTAHAIIATVGAFGASSAEDALDGSSVHAKFGAFELPVPARTVRMLALRF